MVKILVGSEKTVYNLYNDLLCAKCPYFAARLKACWNNDDEEVWLEDAEPKDFGVAVDWMYCAELPLYFTSSSSGDKFTYFRSMPTVYKLADKLMMVDLQNALIVSFLEHNQKYHLISTFFSVVDVVELDLCHTPLYQLMIRDAVKHYLDKDCSQTQIEETVAKLSKYPNLLHDVFILITKYHQHPWAKLSPADASQYYVEDRGN